MPLKRDESWPVVDDVETVWAASPMLFWLERRADPSSFVFTRASMSY